MRGTTAHPARRADGSYGSFALTGGEVSRIARGFAETIGQSHDDDPLLLALLVLLKSFTYTQDDGDREYMLLCAEKEFYPYLEHTAAAMKGSVADAYRELITEGGAR